MKDYINLTFGDSLLFEHVSQLIYLLENGGLCILPSDTGYSLSSLPFRRDVIEKLTQILDKDSEPIPLSFGSYAMLKKYVELSEAHLRIINGKTPGPLTLVCKIKETLPPNRKKQIGEMLNTVGTIGVRVPDSPVERQLSVEMDKPLTTCAIRNSDKKIIQKFDDAFDIVRSRISDLNIKCSIAGIKMARIKYSDHSTVLSIDQPTESPYIIKIIRPGVIGVEEIRDQMRRIRFMDTEEWT